MTPDYSHDDIADRLARLDESIADGDDVDSNADIERLSDCLKLVDRVRLHTPGCVADLLTDDVADSMWLDGGDEHPRHIGRFEIRRKLGEGGFGLVFLAYDPELERDVALKVPRVEALVTEQTRNRFLREAKAAGSLNHPNIAAVYEAGRAGPICYIASEFCAGGSLAERIRSGSSGLPVLSPQQAASLVCGLARAIEHAHSRGILHRDLKPGNILFDGLHPNPLPGGEGTDCADADLASAARIVDFGLARTIESDGGTRTGVVLGTPAYMSPEQAAADAQRTGPGSDVYSLGAILFELLTGKPPFLKSSEIETILAVRNDEPVAPRRLNRSCPTDLEAVCLKCLEKRPEARYSTAALLADDLQRFLVGEPVHARTIGPVTRAWRLCKRYPAAAVAAVLVGVLAVAGPIVAVNQSRLHQHAETARENAEVAREETRQLLYISDVNLGLQDWADANTGRVGELLKRHVPESGQTDLRGFEWYYLWKKWRDSQHSTAMAEDAGIEALALSPDGMVLAVGRVDGIISLWNMPQNIKLGELSGHLAGVFSLAFSPDGTQLVSTGFDATVRLWDVTEGRETHRFPGSWSVDFSRDGRQIAFRTEVSDIALVDVDRAAAFAVLPSTRPAETESLQHGADGVRLIRKAHDDFIVEMAFALRGEETLASTGADGTVRLWDTDSGEELLTYSGHAARTWAVNWSGSGRAIASGDVDGVIRLWSSTGQEHAVLTGHSGTIMSLAFSPDDRLLASASSDNTVRLWDLSAKTLLAQFTGHAAEASDVLFSKDGRQLISCSPDGLVKVWQTAALNVVDVIRHPKSVGSIEFSPDGRTLVSGCRDGKVREWNTDTGQIVREFRAFSHEVATVRFAQAGDRNSLLTAGQDTAATGEGRHNDSQTDASSELPVAQATSWHTIGRLKLWNDAEVVPWRQFETQAGHHELLPLASQGSLIAWQATLHDLQVFDILRNREVAGLKAAEILSSLAFSPDGRLLAAGGSHLAIHEISTAPPRTVLTDLSSPVDCVSFSADGSILAISCEDRTIRLCSLTQDERGTHATPLRILRGHSGAVRAVVFSPDGRTLFSAGADRTVRIWDIPTGLQRAVLKGHTDSVDALVLSPDGQTLASGGSDNTMRLWRTAPAR